MVDNLLIKNLLKMKDEELVNVYTNPYTVYFEDTEASFEQFGIRGCIIEPDVIYLNSGIFGKSINIKGATSKYFKINNSAPRTTLFFKDKEYNQSYVFSDCSVIFNIFEYTISNYLMKYEISLYTEEQIQTEDEYNMSKALM